MATLKKYSDVSFDLETLGTKFNAPIISIGAVAFDRDIGKIGPNFYQQIDISSALKIGKVDGKTISWWMNQSEEARKIFPKEDDIEAWQKKLPVSVAMQALTNWLRDNADYQVRVWGKPATFDITILEYAYEVGCVAQPVPWKFWNIRDLNTTMDDAGLEQKDFRKKGVHHNALDDAINQADMVIAARAKIRGPQAQVKKFTEKAIVAAATAPVEDDDDEL